MYSNNNEEYKDLKQEISYQLIKSHSQFKADSKLSTWVYKVSLYTALSFIKRKPRAYKQLDDVSNKLAIEDEFDEWNTILLQIKKLSETDKMLVFLYLEDKSYRDIANILGISESNVGVKLNRIKKRLKEYFREE